VVGTYRRQTGVQVLAGLGYDSEREFNFLPLEPRQADAGRDSGIGPRLHPPAAPKIRRAEPAVEGHCRSCKGHGARYPVGCSSLTSQDETVGAAAVGQLSRHLAPAPWQTLPQPGFDRDSEPSTS